MAIANRKDIRKTIADDITAHIPTVQFVAAYLGDPGKKSPAITLRSRGTGEDRLGYVHRFTAHLLIIAGQNIENSQWTEENAEDAADDLRRDFDTYIANGTYPSLERDGDSLVESVLIGGEQYLDEQVPIRVRQIHAR